MGESAAVLLGVVDEKITDAEFEVISTPAVKVGDEHPQYPGWHYTGRIGDDGSPLMINPQKAMWYRPDGFLRRIVLWLFGYRW